MDFCIIFFSQVLFHVIIKGNDIHSTRQPNIICILADDLGNGDVGFTKAGAVKTPNLDKLASEGWEILWEPILYYTSLFLN